MKCPKCGADSNVLSTRAYQEMFLRRRRRCFNEHTFYTYEVYAGNLDQRTLDNKAAQARRARVEEKSKAMRRKLHIAKHPGKPSIVLAVELGITDSRVRQIRKELLAV